MLQVNSRISKTKLSGFSPNSGLRKVCYDTSVVATYCQLGSTSVDAQCDKLATVVGRTKLAMLATVDVRLTILANLSHWEFTFVNTVRKAARFPVYLPQLIGLLCSTLLVCPHEAQMKLLNSGHRNKTITVLLRTVAVWSFV